MKSTLYLKFVVMYLIFGFLSIFTASLLSSSFIEDPLTEKYAIEIYKDATQLANDYLPGYFDESIKKENIDTELDGMSDYLNAAVWFVKRDGTLITYSNNSSLELPPNKISDFNPTEIGNAQYEVGTFHDYFSSDVLTVIVPIIHNYEPQGYLLVHKSTADINDIISLMKGTVYIVTIVMILFSGIILIGFHFFVYKPLQLITKAATTYAAGDLDYVIPIKSQDEMGYLSASLNYMSAQLRDMEESQKKFVANVSHDFRSPLTSIRGYIMAMTDGTIPPELYEKYLNIILFETERLTDLTQDLLTLNEFDKKNLILDKKEFDLHEVIKNVAASFEGVCINKHISIELIFATKKMMVFADQRKIQQVLYNLLDNAIKFSDNDSTITIETTEKNDKVMTSVKDYGIGIARNELNKIWDRFYKSDASRGKDKKGTGLGLAIVKEAISAHGENINVISTKGVGTEFVFSLSKAGNN